MTTPRAPHRFKGFWKDEASRVKADKVYREIDWPLFVMFAGLFIVIEGPLRWHRCWPVISRWSARSHTPSSFMGPGAHLLVGQRARADGVNISFWAYFKVGAPLTVLTILIGVVWLQAIGGGHEIESDNAGWLGGRGHRWRACSRRNGAACGCE